QPHDTAGLLAALGHQRAPAADLLHILQADDPRLAGAGPVRHNPGPIPDLLLARLSAGGLAVATAVRAGVEPAEAAPGQRRSRVHLPYISLQVQGARVVGLVHADGSRIVVDGDVYWPAQPHLQPGAGPAAAGEQIHIDLFIVAGQGQGILGAKNGHGLPSIFCSMNRASDWAWPTSSIAANRAWACGLMWLHALIIWRSMARSSAFCRSRSAMRSAGSPEKRSVVMAGLPGGYVPR